MVLLGAAYTPASWSEVLLHWSKYARFVYPFVLLFLLTDRARWQKLALDAFCLGMLFITLSSWLNVWFVLPWSASHKPGWGENHYVVGDHITQNLMMAFFVIVALQKAVESARAPDLTKRNWRGFAYSPASILWAGAAALASISITHLSYGRTGALVLLVALLSWACASLSGKRLLVGLGLLSVLMAGAWWSSGAMSSRIAQAVVEAEHSHANHVSSIGHRLYNYQITPKMIAEAPLFGHGTGSYHSQICRFMEDPSQCATYSWHPHNQFLMLGAEHGLVGMLLYALMIFLLYRAAWQSPQSAAKVLLYCLASILLVDSLLNTPFYSSRESQFFSYMMALLISMTAQSKQVTEPTTGSVTDSATDTASP
jgi:O-antigen ligase